MIHRDSLMEKQKFPTLRGQILLMIKKMKKKMMAFGKFQQEYQMLQILFMHEVIDRLAVDTYFCNGKQFKS